MTNHVHNTSPPARNEPGGDETERASVDDALYEMESSITIARALTTALTMMTDDAQPLDLEQVTALYTVATEVQAHIQKINETHTAALRARQAERRVTQ